MQDAQLKLWQQSIKLLRQLESLAEFEREQKLDQLAGSQPELHQMLLQLLRNKPNQSPLDRMPQQLLGINVNLNTQRVGDYQLLEEISASAMGTVYRARRADGRYRQQVAIKLLAASENKENHARFLSERQFLAKLEHPGITRILDAGEFADGVPYVVMEWVDGINMINYCRQQKLSISARLKLFCKVCDAIHYAHQHLIVHGDIKPDNILVTGDGLPKLLDFGIAHRLDQGADQDPGAGLFTTGYASPEQLQQHPTTTASDIFSLGLVLYELAFDQHAFAVTSNFQDWQQQVSKMPPRRLEKKQQRKLGIHRDWQEDLQSICLHALAKQPRQRYPSALAISDDLQRMLNNQPVSTRHAGWWYITSKFFRRYTWAAASALLAAVIALVSITVLSLQRIELREALITSEQQRLTAEQTTHYIQDMMLQADPHEHGDTAISLDQVLITGADQLADRFAEQPEVKANLAYTLGQVLQNLGQYERAMSAFDMVLAVPGNPYHGVALSSQASILRELEQYSQAWAKSTQAEQLLQIEQNLDWAKNRFVQSGILTRQSRFQEAAALIEETLIATQRLPIELNLDKLIALGTLYWSQDLLDDALHSYRRGYNLAYSTYGLNHHQTARFQYAQAAAVHRLGRFSDAESAYLATLGIQQNVYGDDHPNTIKTKNALGTLLYDLGKNQAAANIMEDNLAKLRALQPLEQAQLSRTLVNYALVLHDLGNFAQAETIYFEAAPIIIELHGEDSIEYARYISNLALLYLDQNQIQSAMPLLEQSYAMFQKVYASNHRSLSFSQLHFARAYLKTQQFDSAKLWLDLAINNRRQLDNGQHSLLADALIWQMRIAMAEGQLELASSAVDEAVTIRELNFGTDNWRTHEAHALAGLVNMLRQPDNANAKPNTLNAYLAMVANRGEHDWRVLRLRNDLQPVLHMLIATIDINPVQAPSH